MKPPAKNPEYTQTGCYSKKHEAKKKCPDCGLYMYKQSSRKMIDGRNGWIPTSWLCRKCGHMELYDEGFEAVKLD